MTVMKRVGSPSPMSRLLVWISITHVPALGLAPAIPSQPLLLRPFPPPFLGRIAAAIPPLEKARI